MVGGTRRNPGAFTGLDRRRIADAVAAGAVAAALSGLPSTLWGLVRGGDPLEAALAAGSILLPRETRRMRLVAAAVPVHAAVSVGWAAALAYLLPRRPTVLQGAAAGLAIAALDLGLVGRVLPRIRSLPLAPQLADHAVYGGTVAFVLARRR
jgi:hypothetical protein